jgi:DNA-binding NarL/FixJ family response regulator
MIRVVIIEDDPTTLDLIAMAVADAQDIKVVATARNVQDGLALVAAGGYDVMLCDLGLPDGSGTTLIKASAAAHPESDIIVITIFADQAKVVESIKSGARGYLLKDGAFEDCIDGIREIRRGGSPINPNIARQLLDQMTPSTDGTANNVDHGLSPRETEVLNLLARGFSYSEIAELLKLSSQTIGSYVKQLYRKLEVNSRSEAVFEASSRGIMNVH